jgi:hypothetical protein
MRMKPTRPEPLPLFAIQQLAARDDDTVLVLRAGVPHSLPAPGGMGDILRRGGQTVLGTTGGLTLIKSAAAFTAPTFITTNQAQRNGSRVDHYATVQRTTSSDAIHECFYPAAGDHLRPGMSQQISGHTYNHYWRISQRVSDLIRQGEQEHLDDALRAYQITYKCVEDAINALFGQRFGPANTPADAERLAEVALSRRLPPQLGTNPANWVQVLDRLLGQSKTRDSRSWHALSIDPPLTIGNMIVHPVSNTATTQIGRVPSSQVVNY